LIESKNELTGYIKRAYDFQVVYLHDCEPIVNVTRRLKDVGHQVLFVIPEFPYFKMIF